MNTLKTTTNFLISGDLTQVDNVINNTFLIAVQLPLTEVMLEFVVSKTESYLGVNW